MEYTQKDATERWERNAAQWHHTFVANDPSRRYLLDPLVLQLLGSIKGKRILDAGCGDGYLARKLARLGAVVTGVEISPKMLSFALAEQECVPLNITYYQGDIAWLPYLAENSLDTVITNNVIQDTERYREAFQEFFRILRPGGTYLQIINHPCFATPVWGWVRDEKGKRLYKKVDYYFRRGPLTIEWRLETGLQPTISWHQTLGDYINSLIDCGFRLARLIEPEPTEELFRMFPDRADGDSRIPDFVLMVCLKE